MALTPVDLLHKDFKRAWRGYHCAEVQEFLREAADEIEQLLTERSRLKDERQALQQRVAQFERIEDTLQKTLIMAQQSAEDTCATAQRKADLIVGEAERSRDRIIEDARRRAAEIEDEAAHTRALADRFLAEFRALLGAQSDLLENWVATRWRRQQPVEDYDFDEAQVPSRVAMTAHNGE